MFKTNVYLNKKHYKFKHIRMVGTTKEIKLISDKLLTFKSSTAIIWYALTKFT